VNFICIVSNELLNYFYLLFVFMLSEFIICIYFRSHFDIFFAYSTTTSSKHLQFFYSMLKVLSNLRVSSSREAHRLVGVSVFAIPGLLLKIGIPGMCHLDQPNFIFYLAQY